MGPEVFQNEARLNHRICANQDLLSLQNTKINNKLNRLNEKQLNGTHAE